MPLWRSIDRRLIAGQTVGFDGKMFRDRLQTLVDHPDLRRRMAAESRRRAVSLYDWQHVALRYEELWNELIEQSSRIARPRRPSPAGGQAGGRAGATTVLRTLDMVSAELDMTAFVEISALGARALAGETNVPIYLALESAFSLEPLQRILTHLASQGPARIGPLVDELSHRDKPSSIYLRHVLFALKHGYIEFAGATMMRPAPTEDAARVGSSAP
jgi:hypothetical protein